MFKKEKHVNILMISTLIFGILLEMFALSPSVLVVVLGYFVVLGSVFLHYDIHWEEKHKSPFKSVYLEHLSEKFIPRIGLTLFKGFAHRFRHLYHKDNIFSHLNFIIQPSFLYWSTISLLFFFINPFFVQILIVVATVSYMLILASISKIYQKALLIEERYFHLLTITKTLVVFLSFMASYAYYYFRLVAPYHALALVLATTLALLYQFAWKSGELYKKDFAWAGIFWSALFVCLITFMLIAGNVPYFLAVVCLFAAYYLCFGVLKHYLFGDLTKKIFVEYLVSAAFLIVLVWANTYFDKMVV